MKLNLTLNNGGAKPDGGDTSAKLRDAAAKRTAQSETLVDAWQRILTMKNSDADQARLQAVKQALDSGQLGREAADAGKRFSKAEALRMYKVLAGAQRESKLAELVAKTPDNYYLVDTATALDVMITDILDADIIAFDCETFGEKNGALDPWEGNVAGFSVTTPHASYYVPLNHDERTELAEDYVIGKVKQALEQAKIVMHNAPFDCKWFAVHYDIDMVSALHADTRIMAMALDENRDHRLKNLLTDWLREESDNFDELFPNIPFNKVALDVALPYAAGDTEKTLKLYNWMMRHLNTPALEAIRDLLFNVEMPVAREFIYADLRGVNFDVERAAKLDRQLADEAAELERNIYDLLGEEINLNSPAQVSRKFFDELGLTDHGKGSTNSRFIKKIQREHEVVPMYSEYKELGKLRQAFTEKLPRDVKGDGRIHPWHNTWGAATGRFTCKSPNTQQIPAKRTEIRHLFKTSADDRIFVSIDYSQIELRVLAHLANEDVLIKAFDNGQDIHSTTAALISNGQYTYEDVEQHKNTEGHPCQKYRKQAKVVNFGIVYGMGSGKLGDTLGITGKEAQVIIDNYFKGYPGIRRYMDEQHRKVHKDGFIADIFGRKRRLRSEIKSRERWKVLSAERMAGNFPIQSSAGSILKKAIVDLASVLPQYDARIALQIHDEIMFECPRDISREALRHIREVMEQAVKLKCPVRCDLEIYPERWQEEVPESEWFNGGNN